jgi:tripartite-type tricarboxylate transporter receptor subunit TctC
MRGLGRVFTCLLALCGAVSMARAQDAWPTRPVRMVMPFPPGSSTDIIARIMADQLSKRWGQAVTVDNVVGASGNIGAATAFRAAPDGYTLLFAPPTAYATNHLLFKDPGYDYARWSPLGLVTTAPYVLSTRPDFPGSSVKDLVDYAKANAGKTTFASAGAGSTVHLSAIEFGRRAGLNLVHVPFRGAAPALTAVMASQVDFLFDVISTSMPLLADQKVKALGVGSDKRSIFLPDVPTIAEQGFPGFRAVTWFAMAGPPGMAPALIEKINADIRAILALPDVVERIRSIRMDVASATPSETIKWFREEAELWGRIIRDAGITPND